MMQDATNTNQTTGMVVETALNGQMLLESPLLNKGSAFPEEERAEFNLLGLLPPHIASMEDQLARTYENYKAKESDLERYIYLASLHDRNETLFFRLVSEHIEEMTPTVYTPTVGLACQYYSHIYRRPRGLYVAYPYRDQIETVLRNSPLSEVRVIVVTDGERILGLGDLGTGGMEIPVGKLALYTLCAGIHPATTLPIILDVGTNNAELLHDPLYMGWHQQRIRGQEYDAFIDAFVQAVKRVFPQALLQWEDFSKGNARRLLDHYRDQLCTFNDDIQGTGAVTLAGLLTAVKVLQEPLSKQRIVMLGAGSSAIGIAEQLAKVMESEGASQEEARASLWLLDSQGLVQTGRTDLEKEKQPFAQPQERIAQWQLAQPGKITLQDVVANVHPTILIGTSAQAGAFTEDIVREMARHVAHPIIFPLSNPTSKSEAHPADIIAWTQGQALVATGSPFAPVKYSGRTISIGQCNNMFIFPGVGLGVIASQARFVKDEMFIAAARALSEYSPANEDPDASLYPAVEDVHEVARRVAFAVGKAAQQTGVAEQSSAEELERRIKATMWTPQYPRLTRKRQ
ncbi:MAG TPA: NAD-dependent malic enzyme [Ktedonobacteraceae bacterium]|nr:NAD-dependent malic enzyme [Ktedonobacteraceae bacterium]